MYKQFNKETRKELATLLRAQLAPKECAKQLGMNKSSVTREIARYSDDDKIYRGSSAHKKYLANRKKSKEEHRKIQNDSVLEKHIRERLKERDSPEQIAGRIRRENKIQSISGETIYWWIFNEVPELKKCLRRIGHKGKYRRKRGTKIREKARERAKIKRIDERPLEVETRERIGDYEGDTIIGKDKTKRLLSNVERRSGYGMLDKLDFVTAEIVQAKIQKRFSKIPKSKKYTYTYDNGTEIGKEDSSMEKRIKMDMYRAHPYHSWERGSNENYNGLVRDFFPKGTDFAIITDKEVKRVERNLNNRPRKRLNYLTPYEVFVLEMDIDAVQG